MGWIMRGLNRDLGIEAGNLVECSSQHIKILVQRFCPSFHLQRQDMIRPYPNFNKIDVQGLTAEMVSVAAISS